MPILALDVPLIAATVSFPDGTTAAVPAPPGTYRHAVVASPVEPSAAVEALTERADVHGSVADRLESIARAPRFVVERRPRVAGSGSSRVLALVGSGIPREHRSGSSRTEGGLPAQPDVVLLPARDPGESDEQREAWTASAARELVARALLRASGERTQAVALRARAERLSRGLEPLGRWSVLEWVTEGRSARRVADEAAARCAVDGRSVEVVEVVERAERPADAGPSLLLPVGGRPPGALLSRA